LSFEPHRSRVTARPAVPRSSRKPSEHPVNLADFTKPELVLPALKASSPEAAVVQLGQTLARAGCVPDAAEFGQAVFRREALAGTACLPFTAIPHARIPGLTQPWFALGRCWEPLIWHGASTPVRWVLLLAIPELETTRYLALLSLLSGLGPGAWLDSHYQNAPDAAGLYAALRTSGHNPRSSAALAQQVRL